MVRRVVFAFAAIAGAPAACGGQPTAPRDNPPPLSFHPLPPPVPLRLVHDGSPGGHNPSERDRKLALFSDDEWGRVLPCPRDLDDNQPADPDRHRCAYRAAAALGLAGHTVWAGVAVYGHEFDGMYSQEQGIVLVEPGPQPRVIATLIQWNEDVVDCRSLLRMRRRNLADLDGDGLAELCVETVDEAGVGLFETMDLGEHGKWQPNRRTRRIEAFVYDPVRARLERAPRLDARCPHQGYIRFVDTPVLADPLAWRLDLQGAQRPARCPDPDQVNSCFDVCN